MPWPLEPDHQTMTLWAWSRHQADPISWTIALWSATSGKLATAYREGRYWYVRIPLAWQRELGLKGAIRTRRHYGEPDQGGWKGKPKPDPPGMVVRIPE